MWRYSSEEKAGVICSCAASTGLNTRSVVAASKPAGPLPVVTETIMTTENRTTKAKKANIVDPGNPRFQTDDFRPKTDQTPRNRYAASKAMTEEPPANRAVSR